MKKDAKVIFSPQLANFLLSRGYTIIKLKPKHEHPDETVYVFRLEDGLLESIEDWMDDEDNEDED
jgi:predicted CoA-binding protein